MTDRLLHALAFDDHVRVLVAVTTETVQTAARIHGTSAVATQALGRLLTGVALLGATLKSHERLSVQLQGNGPLGMLLARSHARGQVYGTIGNPAYIAPDADPLDVGGAVGTNGLVMVSRDTGAKEPYVGVIPVTTGEIGDDLARYLRDSEQVVSAIGLSVVGGGRDDVRAAGGFLVQLLGGVPDSVTELLDRRISAVGRLSARLEEGQTVEELLESLLGSDARIVGTSEVVWNAPQDRNYYALRLASLQGSLDELFGDDEEISLTCEFTRETFRFSRHELEQLGQASLA